MVKRGLRHFNGYSLILSIGSVLKIFEKAKESPYKAILLKTLINLEFFKKSHLIGRDSLQTDSL